MAYLGSPVVPEVVPRIMTESNNGSYLVTSKALVPSFTKSENEKSSNPTMVARVS